MTLRDSGQARMTVCAILLMTLYYKAVTRDGKFLNGLIEARDEKEAAGYLRSKDFIPITISRQEGTKLSDFIPIFSSRVKSKDIVAFTRHLSSMLTSGITLIRSLEIIKNQVNNDALKEVLESMTADIEEGKSLSMALSKYPQIFSPVYVSLIRASESSGLLDKALLRLADTLEKQQKLKGTIKAALAYPVIVVTMMIAVTFIMMIFVIPQLSSLYENLNVELPLPTLILITLSNWTIMFWPIVLGIIIISIYLFTRWHRTLEGKIVIDGILLKMPIFGKIIKNSILSEFSRTLGAMLGSGTLVIESLKEASDATGNVLYRNAVLDVAKRIEKGITMGDAMSIYNLFPQNLVELVKIGEQTGKLDETLVRASEYFENEVDQSVKILTTALEPAIMVALGIGVAFLVFSIIMPIYQLTNTIQ
ncbi:MAG: type II secretion system F family protein [Candidatus Levybacteria bacterium]|nr:type II secretion system F family protein [Candidatus Levybacteria bacterium]